MRILLFWLLTGVVVYAAETMGTTNDDGVLDSLNSANNWEVMKFVEAMTVEAGDETSEAVEVDKLVKRVEAEESAGKPKNIDPWEAFVPPVDSKFDWLQLTSGEWLKGEFKVIYNYTLEFGSEELGLQKFDFKDVKQLRTRAMKTVFISGEDDHPDITLRGLLFIKGDQVLLRRSEHEVSIPRGRVLSIAGGRQRESDYWSGMASIGINSRGGNTETLNTTYQANLKRRTARNRLNADYLANYSSTKSVETSNNHRISIYHDFFLISQVYWRTLSAEYYRDPFSNIDKQYSVGTGIGYDIIHTPQTEWAINSGVGFQEMRFDSVQPGESQTSKSPFLTAGSKLDYKLTGNFDILYEYSMRWLNKDNGQYTHHMLATISFNLIGKLNLNVSEVWDRVEKPQLDADDNIPKKDDYQLIVSLAYDF
jgi:putative salt-induced outer membrane protein YdiY